MKKIIYFLLFALYLFSNVVFANNTTISQKLTQIETSIYGFNYSSDPDTKRLERIEKYAYGSISSNKNVPQRVSKLMNDLNIVPEEQIASSNSNYAYEEVLSQDESVEYPAIDRMEEQIFKKVNKNENIYLRLSKLENNVFKKENKDLSLNERVEKLQSVIYPDNFLAQNNFTHNEDTIHISQEDANRINAMQPNYYSPKNNYYDSDILSQGTIYNELSLLEKDILKSTYPTKSVDERLNQLESKVFQRNYINDEPEKRIERLAAAFDAQNNGSTLGGGGKFEKHLATGIQVASFLLMILAFVL